MERRIVCAAIRCINTGRMLVGVRHFDAAMYGQANAMHDADRLSWKGDHIIQGFLDNKGAFLTREEAWVVADAAKQIIRRVGGDNQKLFSENLY